MYIHSGGCCASTALACRAHNLFGSHSTFITVSARYHHDLEYHVETNPMLAMGVSRMYERRFPSRSYVAVSDPASAIDKEERRDIRRKPRLESYRMSLRQATCQLRLGDMHRDYKNPLSSGDRRIQKLLQHQFPFTSEESKR